MFVIRREGTRVVGFILYYGLIGSMEVGYKSHTIQISIKKGSHYIDGVVGPLPRLFQTRYGTH